MDHDLIASEHLELLLSNAFAVIALTGDVKMEEQLCEVSATGSSTLIMTHT